MHRQRSGCHQSTKVRLTGTIGLRISILYGCHPTSRTHLGFESDVPGIAVFVPKPFENVSSDTADLLSCLVQDLASDA